MTHMLWVIFFSIAFPVILKSMASLSIAAKLASIVKTARTSVFAALMIGRMLFAFRSSWMQINNPNENGNGQTPLRKVFKMTLIVANQNEAII